jgi:hypothetical protein
MTTARRTNTLSHLWRSGWTSIVMSNTTTTRPTDLVHWRLDPTSVGRGLCPEHL